MDVKVILGFVIVGVVCFFLGMAWKSRSAQRGGGQMLISQPGRKVSSLQESPKTRIDDASLEQVKDLIRAKQKIEAIKLFREQTDVGLKEAKDAVDAIEKEM
jgi:large subunit ribosomal protein L7/L12